MTMLTPNELPDAPDWVPMPRDWDAAKCCPADCSMCGDLTVPANVELGTE